MPLSISLQPMTEADRDAMRRASDFDAGFGKVALAIALAAAGVAAAWWAFKVIGVNVLLAMGLLIGGTVIVVIGVAMLSHAGSMWFAKRRVDRENREANEGGEVEQWVIEADAVWLAPTVDEDAGAVLLRVEPDRFIYFNAPWVDEQQDAVEDPGELWKDFPPNWVIRRLPVPGGLVLSALAGPERLPCLDFPDVAEKDAQFLMAVGSRSAEVVALDREDLPRSWRDHLA